MLFGVNDPRPPLQIPPEAIPYDLPDAALKRDARRATVEVLIEQESVQDSIALRLADLIHDIEINSWAVRRVSGSLTFQQTLTERMYAVSDIDSSLAICICLLDLYRRLDGDLEQWELAQDSCITAE